MDEGAKRVLIAVEVSGDAEIAIGVRCRGPRSCRPCDPVVSVSVDVDGRGWSSDFSSDVAAVYRISDGRRVSVAQLDAGPDFPLALELPSEAA